MQEQPHSHSGFSGTGNRKPVVNCTVMNTDAIQRKNMSVHLDTHERIQSWGRLSDSFDDVINLVFDFAESKGMTRDTLTEFRRGNG